jgi:hypothetical protein
MGWISWSEVGYETFQPFVPRATLILICHPMPGGASTNPVSLIYFPSRLRLLYNCLSKMTKLFLSVFELYSQSRRGLINFY